MTIKRFCVIGFNVCFMMLLSGFIYILPYSLLTKYYGTACALEANDMMLSITQHRIAQRFRYIIALSIHYMPWKPSCLNQALLAKFWCYWCDLPYQFIIGIPINTRLSSVKAAHAWVTSGPVVLTDGDDDCFEQYHVIGVFSRSKNRGC